MPRSPTSMCASRRCWCRSTSSGSTEPDWSGLSLVTGVLCGPSFCARDGRSHRTEKPVYGARISRLTAGGLDGTATLRGAGGSETCFWNWTDRIRTGRGRRSRCRCPRTGRLRSSVAEGADPPAGWRECRAGRRGSSAEPHWTARALAGASSLNGANDPEGGSAQLRPRANLLAGPDRRRDVCRHRRARGDPVLALGR